MRQALKSLGCGKKSDPSHTQITNSASVVDGKLILSFPEAQTPVIWQMDLMNAKSSALEVQEKDKELCALVLKTHKGETVEIAIFKERKQAVAALMSASYALQNAQGQIQPFQAGDVHPVSAVGALQTPQVHVPRKKGKWIAAIITLALIIFLVNAINSLTPRPSSLLSETNGNVTAQNAQNNDAVGVPVSADTFLRGQ